MVVDNYQSENNKMHSSNKTKARKSIGTERIKKVLLNIKKTNTDKKNGLKTSIKNVDVGKKSAKKIVKQLYNIGKIAIENKSISQTNKKRPKDNQNHHFTNFTVIKETYTNVQMQKIKSFDNFIKPERTENNVKSKRLSDSGIMQNKKVSKLASHHKNDARSAPNLKLAKLPPRSKNNSLQKVRQKPRENLKTDIKHSRSGLPDVAYMPRVTTERKSLCKVIMKLPKVSEEQKLPTVLRNLSGDRIRSSYKRITSQVSIEQNKPIVLTDRNTSSKAQTPTEKSRTGKKRLHKLGLKIRPTSKLTNITEPNVIFIKQFTEHDKLSLKVDPHVQELYTTKESKEDVTVLSPQIGNSVVQHVEVIKEAGVDKILDTFDIDKYAIDVCKQTASTILEKLNKILDRLEIILSNQSSQKCIVT